jgi:gliding motility-associated peptidyl-prolyl isomerase
MKLQHLLFASTFLVLICSCSQRQEEARRPISHASGTFIKKSIERNKKLIATEEKIIDSIIKNDTLKEYTASKKGYWYKYETKIETVSDFPKRGDIAYFDYEVKDIENTIIYTKTETKPQVYYVDKQNILTGLRDGIKLMKKGETISFLFPSHMAYGYHGDDQKIGINQPIICTVTLKDIQPDPQAEN